MELNPYVYDFARALIDAAKNSEKEAHESDKQLSQIALENKIEGVKLALQNERFALDDRPFDFGIRVESVESMLRNLEVELNAMSSSE